MWYENSDIEQILTATGRGLQDDQRRQFVERLEESASSFLRDFGFEKRAPPSAVTKRLDNIAAQSKKLMQLMKLPEAAAALTRLDAQATYYRSIAVRTISPDGSVEGIRPSEFPSIGEAVKAVESLALYARNAADRERGKQKPGTDKNRYKGNVARQTFINDLAGIWVDTFGEMPGGSIKTDAKSNNGPFIRFVLACYTPLQQQFTTLPVLDENAARGHYRKTAEARLKRIFPDH